MGTFDAFTCEMPLGGSREWNRAFMRAMGRHGGVGRLSGLGDAPVLTPEQQACYARSRTRASEVRPSQASGYYGASADSMYWLGMFISPKADVMGRFMLIDGRWNGGYDMSAVTLFRPGGGTLLNLGTTGYDSSSERTCGRPEPQTYDYLSAGTPLTRRRVDERGMPVLDARGRPVYDAVRDTDGTEVYSSSGGGYLHPMLDARGLVRGHSPGGVMIKGLGHGAVGYAAAAVGAILHMKQNGSPIGAGAPRPNAMGLYSIDTTRSDEASALWSSGAKANSGPLTKKIDLPIAKRGGSVVKIATMRGYDGHCPTEMLEVTRTRDANGCLTGAIVCKAPHERIYRDFIPAYYIDIDGLARWGLTVFSPLPIPRGGVAIPARYHLKPEAAKKGNAGGPSSAWDLEAVRRAFGPRIGQDRTFAMRSALRDTGAERLKNAEVGPSIPLYTKLCGVMQGYLGGEQWVIDFLSRADIGSVLRADPSGVVLLNSYGQGTPLEGLSAAAWRDIHRAVRTERSPLDLNLAPLSRETQREVDAYPAV
jgi:hypothetical protein